MKQSKDSATFRENLAGELNNPDKLPVTDIPEFGGEWNMWNISYGNTKGETTWHTRMTAASR